VTAHRLIVRSCAERDIAEAIGEYAAIAAGLGRMVLARTDSRPRGDSPRDGRLPQVSRRKVAANLTANIATSFSAGFRLVFSIFSMARPSR
jgi:hypothetical protein